MADLLQLGLHCRDHLRVIMTDVQNADAADEVQVARSVHVPHLSTLGPVDDQRVCRDQTPWHELIALTEQTRGFFDFTVHGISHSEPGNRETAAMCSTG